MSSSLLQHPSSSYFQLSSYNMAVQRMSRRPPELRKLSKRLLPWQGSAYLSMRTLGSKIYVAGSA
eukprot:551517-Hanusia_phi.AAC.2